MGRPAASSTNKQFSLSFANVVTYQSDSCDDIVARCGKCSIFSVLNASCPAIVRNEDAQPRDGISEVEFNKVLQVSGFIKFRNRRVGASNRFKDPLGAGFYVFGFRRWRNPDNRKDSAALQAGLEMLSANFPNIKIQVNGLLVEIRRKLQEWDNCLYNYSPRQKRRISVTGALQEVERSRADSEPSAHTSDEETGSGCPEELGEVDRHCFQKPGVSVPSWSNTCDWKAHLTDIFDDGPLQELALVDTQHTSSAFAELTGDPGYFGDIGGC